MMNDMIFSRSLIVGHGGCTKWVIGSLGWGGTAGKYEMGNSYSYNDVVGTSTSALVCYSSKLQGSYIHLIRGLSSPRVRLLPCNVPLCYYYCMQ